MASADIFCSACGARNPGDARFCSRCGTALHRPDAPDASTASAGSPALASRPALGRAGGWLARYGAERAVEESLGALLGALGVKSLLGAAGASVLLALSSGAHSFLGWLALTWPLTFAAAAVVATTGRAVTGLAIVPAAAAFLFAAAWVGAALAGSPVAVFPLPPIGTLGTGLVFGYLGRFHAAYGTAAFFAALAIGALIGATARRVRLRRP